MRILNCLTPYKPYKIKHRYMFDLDFNEPICDHSIVLIGDIHGKMDDLFYSLERYNIENAYYIVLGDSGLMNKYLMDYFEMTSSWLRINGFLHRTNSKLFFGRGNHDNPAYFVNEKPECLDIFDRIFTLPDHTIIKFKDKYLFWLGGGISIDRKNRTLNNTYFKNEKTVFDFAYFNQVADLYKPSILLSHGLPVEAPPFGLSDIVNSWCESDKSLKRELTIERKNYSKVLSIFTKNNTLEKWYSGHYHTNQGISYNGVVLQNLGIMEFKELFI